ncbi:MAG: D-alanine--D-alanine ligase [Clostridiales bacterium]|nr:D-alanine--D-alanine ligase [Clostridiales bacterium]
MDRKRIAVLFGGSSPEYNVSLHSGHSVIPNIDKEAFEAVPIGITREGDWFRYYGDVDKIASDEWHMDKENCVPAMLVPGRGIHGMAEIKNGEVSTTAIDAAFPLLHGKNGEDGSVQGLLELAGIPVVGCGILSSALCMDKVKSKKLAGLAGVESPKAFMVTKHSPYEEIFEGMMELSYPVFVKPVNAGSSIGITKVYRDRDMINAVSEALKYDCEAIIEENVDGVEVGCAVIGNQELVTGEVDEIELNVDWFDYHEKYSQLKSKIHTPARISDDLSELIKEASKKIYRALGCSGFARIDLFLTKEGELLFNEANTIPGITPLSRFPKMMREAGYSFPELLSKLIELGLDKQ